MALCEQEYELWVRYQRDGDLEARDYLFLKYSPWARKVAAGVFGRLRVPQMEWGDFVQNAVVGMLEAMSRFDPDRGLDFMAYAKLRVQGAVFNGVRQYLTGVDRATMSGRFGQRLESLAEGDDDPGDPLRQFADTVASLGIGYLLESVSAPPANAVSIERGEQAVLRRRLLDALEHLGDRERLVLSGHYLDHIPFQDMAIALGLTKGRISQIHKAGLRKLRARLVELRVDPADYL
jgi:RNA polymerase sigma factor for flagellar operon FliA